MGVFKKKSSKIKTSRKSKGRRSKGDRLSWTPLKDAKHVGLVSELTSSKVVHSNSNFDPLLVLMRIT